MLKSVLQPPFETTPLAAPQPDRHVKTLAERASEQRALYLARPNSVNHRSLWSAICDERHCCYDATRKGGLAHRRAAAAAFPDRNCFPAQIHRRWLRISIRSFLSARLTAACAVRTWGRRFLRFASKKPRQHFPRFTCLSPRYTTQGRVYILPLQF